jgi:hypothetical protein
MVRFHHKQRQVRESGSERCDQHHEVCYGDAFTPGAAGPDRSAGAVAEEGCVQEHSSLKEIFCRCLHGGLVNACGVWFCRRKGADTDSWL